MTKERTYLVILAVVATIGIGSAYVLGYVVGASSYASGTMMGQPWFGFQGRAWPGMMGAGTAMPGGIPQQLGGGGMMMGPGMMGGGMMMAPGLERPTALQNTVIITNYSFYPDLLVVKKGTTVTWINMDHVSHTVESGTHENPTGLFESGLLGHMESFSHTFTELGTYVYHCDPHPYMTGKIIVEG